MGIRGALQRLVVDGGEIEYVDEGVGDPILLVHAGVFGAWFAPLAEEPQLEGFRVIRVVRAGYTMGPPPASHLTIRDHARHCAALLDALGVEHAHLVAHSSGCLIALQLAMDRPAAVRSLVLLEPSVGGDLTPPSFAAVAEEVFAPAFAAAANGDTATAFDLFMRGVCADDYRDVLTQALGADGLRRAERDARFFFADEVPAVQEWVFGAAEATRISQPLLVLIGGSSPPAEHDLVARLASMVPNATTLTVPGGDHLLPLRDPGSLARIAADHARRHPIAASPTAVSTSAGAAK